MSPGAASFPRAARARAATIAFCPMASPSNSGTASAGRGLRSPQSTPPGEGGPARRGERSRSDRRSSAHIRSPDSDGPSRRGDPWPQPIRPKPAGPSRRQRAQGPRGRQADGLVRTLTAARTAGVNWLRPECPWRPARTWEVAGKPPICRRCRSSRVGEARNSPRAAAEHGISVRPAMRQ